MSVIDRLPARFPTPDVVQTGIDEFVRDERAIEGLPVRLVVSLVVGAACLSLMLNIVNGVGTLAVSELDVRPDPEVVGQEPGTSRSPSSTPTATRSPVRRSW